MQKLKTFGLALGLFAGGMVLGQAFEGDVGPMINLKPNEAVKRADAIYTEYAGLVGMAKSAVQVSQASDEARVRLEYLQVKQNAEIIRLLGDLKNKK
ncbi:hypothetical protein DEDE109153_01115 [Deinococcus deserti]|uniref:Uncharacterized protein n=1 Tax=Deinococcus deserti (strain DSM 17065 / CIP 109153 / LMG 22923 / VCD115) TaxID=546414 RepID=C1CVL8_DEIDV|nr:hypothetical protein [Deinococcus deserti]ACO46235.2 Hypothetical protein Deide_13068 [Deinococcus deserti VCD115]